MVRLQPQHPALVNPRHGMALADQLPITQAPRAWQGRDRRFSLDGAEDWRFQLLDEIDYGILVLGAQRKVVYCNQAALAHFKTISLLRVVGGELMASSARDAAALGAAVWAASAQGLRRMVLLGAVHDGLALAVVPGPRYPDTLGNRVLVMLPRRRLCQPLSTHGFARDHRLSATESQVLQLLCDGLGPAEIAGELGVAISTVRTHVVSIRGKTEVASVAELMQRVARLPPICSALAQ